MSMTTTIPAYRQGDERLIKLTANAAKKVSSLLTRQGRPNGVLRVAIMGGGCSGLQYKMDLQDAPANRDIQAHGCQAQALEIPPTSCKHGPQQLFSQ